MAVTCGVSSGAGLAHAQPLPDPTAELRHQEERTQALRQQQEKTPDIKSTITAPDTARLPHGESPCFAIGHLQLVRQGQPAAAPNPSSPSANIPSGATQVVPLWEPTFEWAIKAIAGPQGGDSPIGKCLGAKGIALVIKRAQDSVVEHGYVTTRVLAQEQDLRQGVLTLTVLPGRVNYIRFKSEEQVQVRIKNTVPIRTGDVLNLRDVEQALENLKRVPTAEADIQIEPAKDVSAVGSSGIDGQSDLVVSYQQQTPVRLSATLDDSGSKGTGKYQGSATFSLDNSLGLSDLFYFTSNHDLGGGDAGARGTQGYTVHYSLPLDYWTLGTTYTSNRYFQSVAGASQDYIYSGTSENSEIKLSRLVFRDAVRKTTLSLKGWQRRSNNYIDDTEVLVQRRVVGGWELGVNHKDIWGDNTLEASFAYKRGTGDFDAIPAPEEAFNEGTSKMGMLTLDLTATVPFKAWSNSFKYSTTLHVLDNTTPLTPQDRMSIGGRYTVRGFDGESSLSAERGWTLRNDWSVVLGETGQEAYLALDAGEVSGPGAQNLLGNTLSGGVVGLRGGYKRLQYEVFVGAPLYKPAGFKTAETTAGFSLNMSW